MEELIHASEGAYKWRDLYLQGPTTGIEKTFQNLVFNKLQNFISIHLEQKLRGGGGGLYATSTFPIMHLIWRPKFCITFVFHFS